MTQPPHMKNNRPRTLRAAFSKTTFDDKIGSMMSSTISEWYDAKHPYTSAEEVNLINSIPISQCPYCHSRFVKKYGKRRGGIQNYFCNSCERRFNPLTGTLFDSRKIPVSEWIEYLIHLFQYQSLSVASIDNVNSRNTGKYWLKKVFSVLSGYQDKIRFSGTVWVDETYLQEPPRATVMKEGKRMAGLSRNQICVVTMAQEGHAILIPCGHGKPSKKRIRDVLLPYMKDVGKVVDDGEKSHAAITSELGIGREVHTSSETKGMEDSLNPMDMVNTVHRFFKMFMHSHGGYARKDIRDWCNLFAFIFNHHGNLPKMIHDFFDMALKVRKTIRYRDKN